MSANSKKIEEAARAAESTEQAAAEPAAELPAVQSKRDREYPSPCVYCGPTVRGVARQYTTYSRKIPEALEEFIKEHPAARGLVVPIAGYARTRRALETAGTREALLYQKIKSEL